MSVPGSVGSEGKGMASRDSRVGEGRRGSVPSDPCRTQIVGDSG